VHAGLEADELRRNALVVKPQNRLRGTIGAACSIPGRRSSSPANDTGSAGGPPVMKLRESRGATQTSAPRVVHERRDLMADALTQSEQTTDERDRQRHPRRRQAIQRLVQQLPASQQDEPGARPRPAGMDAKRHHPALPRGSPARIRGRYETWPGELRSSAPPLCGQLPMLARRSRDSLAAARKGAAMKHWHHMAICAGLVAVAIVLVAAGAGAFAFIAPLGCALMMGMMIWMMVRAGGHGGG
jgi:hypothetical protein